MANLEATWVRSRYHSLGVRFQVERLPINFETALPRKKGLTSAYSLPRARLESVNMPARSLSAETDLVQSVDRLMPIPRIVLTFNLGLGYLSSREIIYSIAQLIFVVDSFQPCTTTSSCPLWSKHTLSLDHNGTTGFLHYAYFKESSCCFIVKILGKGVFLSL